MEYREYRENVLKEIENSVNMVDDSQIDLFINKIINANRVFCDGKGRSGLQAKAFAMRLSQMGIISYETSEATTPAIGTRDLLIICSGSGETPNLIEHAKKALSLEAEVVLITTNTDTTLGELCNSRLIIWAESKREDTKKSIQPLGTLFEQTLEIFFDIIVLILMDKLLINNDDMYAKHNNLE